MTNRPPVSGEPRTDWQQYARDLIAYQNGDMTVEEFRQKHADPTFAIGPPVSGEPSHQRDIDWCLECDALILVHREGGRHGRCRVCGVEDDEPCRPPVSGEPTHEHRWAGPDNFASYEYCALCSVPRPHQHHVHEQRRVTDCAECVAAATDFLRPPVSGEPSELAEARALIDSQTVPTTCHTHRVYDCWQCRPRIDRAVSGEPSTALQRLLDYSWGLHLAGTPNEAEAIGLIEAARAEARATPPSLDRLVWRLIESYGGTIEIDNVQRFRDHLADRLTSKEERP